MAKRQTDDHGTEWYAIMPPLHREKSDAIRRTLQANRTVYDRASPWQGTTGVPVTDLEAALDQTQSQLRAIEDSTIWRSTRQLRRFIQAVKDLRRARGGPVRDVSSETPRRNLTYQEWINTEEPAVIRRLVCPGAGHRPMGTASAGLVLWTDERDAGLVAQELVVTLGRIPASYEVMIVCPNEALAAVAEVRGAVRPKLMVEAGGGFAAIFSVALHRMESAYLCFHQLTDGIAESALEIVAAALANQPQTDLLFGDEDWLDELGQRSRSFFKPGWDVELQRGQDLVGPFAFYRTATLRSLAGDAPSGPAWRYDLAGRIVAACQPEHVCHVPAVLCHRRVPAPFGAAEAMRRHAKMHLQSDGIEAEVEPLDGPESWQRVVYALPRSAPLVSVIVPTRDRAELLERCADGVLNQTSYRPIELVIVDNGSEEADALALIDALSRDGRVRVLRQPGPFNWSALNNAAVADAGRGEILVFLNNDISVLRPDWLTALVGLASQHDVGVVGAKLLYDDGRVQHAGITTDIQGVPRHLFRYSDANDAGPSGMLALARGVWAVTGACLAIRRHVFCGVGGFNEGLPVAYNDVDLCMRVTIQGYRTVWTPQAVLGHRELASRPPDHLGARREQVREELNRLTRDWGNLVLRDPFLNPNYQLVNEQPVFSTG